VHGQVAPVKSLRFFRRPVLPSPASPPPPAPSAGPRTYVFAHIPKCGGKTFDAILQRNFTKAYYREEALSAAYKYPAQDVKEFLDRRFTLRAVSSHRLTFDLPWGATARPVLGLTFVRDPVERALSDYFFQRHHPNLDTPAKSLSVGDYIERNLNRLKNFQSVFLGCGQPAQPAAVARLLDLGWAHVFPLERFEEAMLALEHAYPADFRDTSFTVRNSAPRDTAADPAIRELVGKHSPLDTALLALAHQHLDQLLNRLFSSPEARSAALANLRERNSRRVGGLSEAQLAPPR
jgi:hypothetical protein